MNTDKQPRPCRAWLRTPDTSQSLDDDLESQLDILESLDECGFFEAMERLVFPFAQRHHGGGACFGDFRFSAQALKMCGVAESDWPDVFEALKDEGACCDCEVLFNVAPFV